MSEIVRDTVTLALGLIKKDVPNKYSYKQVSDSLREAFIEANGGSTKITYKTLRDHPEIYQIIEEIIPAIVVEGLQGDEFFTELIDYRNIALGDAIEFWVENNSLFVVSDAAQGTQGIRRQRLDVGHNVTITPTLKIIKCFEEFNRYMANRIDFDTLIDKVGKSMINEIYTSAFNALNSITSNTAGLSSTYVQTGSYSEDTLLGIVDHVEAATGMKARIVGTRSALRKITTSVTSDAAKDDMYNLGYYGKFYGTDMILVRQKHIVGTDSFVFPSDKVWIIASNDKPIKVVDEGEGIIIDKDPVNNADLTKEYLYGQNIGVGVVVNAKMGVYTMS